VAVRGSAGIVRVEQIMGMAIVIDVRDIDDPAQRPHDLRRTGLTT
jgi:hypothetical protein